MCARARIYRERILESYRERKYLPIGESRVMFGSLIVFSLQLGGGDDDGGLVTRSHRHRQDFYKKKKTVTLGRL